MAEREPNHQPTTTMTRSENAGAKGRPAAVSSTARGPEGAEGMMDVLRMMARLKTIQVQAMANGEAPFEWGAFIRQEVQTLAAVAGLRESDSSGGTTSTSLPPWIEAWNQRREIPAPPAPPET